MRPSNLRSIIKSNAYLNKYVTRQVKICSSLRQFSATHVHEDSHTMKANILKHSLQFVDEHNWSMDSIAKGIESLQLPPLFIGTKCIICRIIL